MALKGLTSGGDQAMKCAERILRAIAQAIHIDTCVARVGVGLAIREPGPERARGR
ncbi:hypothetical protein GRF61_18085 [Azoarcus sp. TTM-91]|uniref:hypothetical protein n=1 Tax=Azoarcus sp. TTM-91 TaxID=2691581 RepID=UPI00145E698F|nr:hypothetical protein [Azoarcus sp. TTM-91]NMG36362.1 hypothetical protein [Azoarcus sp. TTM-91]